MRRIHDDAAVAQPSEAAHAFRLIRRAGSLATHARGATPCIVAIPVRNEAERIGRCLDALARQRRGRTAHERNAFGVLLVLNSCTDASWEEAMRVMSTWDRPWGLIDGALPPAMDHAGGARAAALAMALARLSIDDGVVLTTDADSEVRPDWVWRNLTALAQCDVVAGDVDVLPTELRALPAALLERHRLESAYAALVAEIDAACDPLAHDPWPSHRTRSGASLGFRAATLARLSELPAPPCGEDRALVDAALAVGARVRHDPLVRVHTSARMSGRAAGGMAETLRLRLMDRTAPCDPSLEPVDDAVCRATLRAAARTAFHPLTPPHALATHLGLAHTTEDSAACSHFHQAWRWMETHVPSLARRALCPTALAAEIHAAATYLADRTGVSANEAAA